MFEEAKIQAGGPAETSDCSHRCGNCGICGAAFDGTLDIRALNRLKSIATRVAVPAGRVLVEEGAALEHVYCFTSGTTKIYRMLPDGRTQVLGFLSDGDLLGLPGSAEATYFVETVSRVEACLFERSRFEQFLKLYPGLYLCLLVMANHEIQTQHEQILVLGRKHVDERLATFLLALLHRNGVNGSTPVVDLPMSRRDVADYLGTTVESISRTLAKFKAAGLIAVPQPYKVVLLRQAALEHMCDFEHWPSGPVAIGL